MIPEDLRETVMQLSGEQLKEDARKRLFQDLADCFSCAEDICTEADIVKTLLDVIEEQRLFYKQKENFYNNLKTTLKFALNEKTNNKLDL